MRVFSFLTKYVLYGFRKYHSCEQAIQEMVGKILQAREGGQQCTSIFLDLSKAFDTLDHTVLLSKMERYGIRDTALDWFKSYLSGHSLRTKIPVSNSQTYYSSRHDINRGTAQGSCLGAIIIHYFLQ